MMPTMGRSKEAYVRDFWSFKCKPMELYMDTIRAVDGEKMLESCTTVKEAIATITIGKFRIHVQFWRCQFCNMGSI